MSACTNETSNPLHAANYAPSVNCNVHPDSPHALTQAAVLLAIQETSNFSPASAPRRRGPLRPPPEVERRTTAPICRIMGTPASCSSKIASVRTVLRTISSLGAHSRTFAPLPACHAAGMASCEGEGERSGSGRTLDDISIRMGRPSVAIQTENENVAGQAPPHRDVLSHIGLGAHAVLAARLTSDHYLLCALQVRRSPDAACNSPDTFCVA